MTERLCQSFSSLLLRTGYGRRAALQLLAVWIRKPWAVEDAPLPRQCAKSDLLYLDGLLAKSCPCNRSGSFTARLHPRQLCPTGHWHPQSISSASICDEVYGQAITPSAWPPEAGCSASLAQTARRECRSTIDGGKPLASSGTRLEGPGTARNGDHRRVL